jgi:hypothetical protein
MHGSLTLQTLLPCDGLLLCPEMWLINTRSLALDEFIGDAVPPYATLSHTWTPREEVSFHEWADLQTASKKKGFRKIELARREALSDGLEYLWVDTNCINKDSSAELTEAINSMFAWYRQATVCYAFLEDVVVNVDNYFFEEQFAHSRWFTRGWTLQELVAPKAVVFFSHSWARLGDKVTLGHRISTVTGIKQSHLTLDIRAPPSIATRMAWLSRRSTTRTEDIAYCMLGIFDINMPLLYGEGTKAFTRLQEEIVKTFDDQTIFCWHWDENVPQDWTSMLAPTPHHFVASHSYFPEASESFYNLSVSPFAMTNVGLSIRLPLMDVVGSRRDTGAGLSVAVLRVTSKDTSRRHPVGIPLWGYTKSGFFERASFPSQPIPLLPDIYDFASEIMVHRRRRIQTSHEVISEYVYKPSMPAFTEAMHILCNHNPIMSSFYLRLYPYGPVQIMDGILVLNTGILQGNTQMDEPVLAPPALRGAFVRLDRRSSKEPDTHLGAFFGMVTHGTYTGWICKVLSKSTVARLNPKDVERGPEALHSAILQELESVSERFKHSGELLPSSLQDFQHFAEGTLSVTISNKSFDCGDRQLLRTATIGFVPETGAPTRSSMSY